MKAKMSLDSYDGLTLLISPHVQAPEGSEVWGVGVLFPKKDTLQEWAQSQMRLIDMFYTHRQEAWYVLPGVGHKGGIWYEFIGPKWEGEIENVE